jgi:eukaryotic-like serine/threonine-protein kinase
MPLRANGAHVAPRNHIPQSGSARYADDVASEVPEDLRVIGDYRVSRALSTGPAIDVLLATKGDRTFVVRVLGETFARNERYADAFHRGATAYAKLDHPMIARAYETLQVKGRPAIVIEHVDGAALNRVRGMMRTVGFGLDDTAALHVAASLFAALAEAHAGSAPTVHRYLSPSKVLIGWDGSIKVRDFGLPEPAKLNASAVAVARGADRYMAPEQVNGKDVTERTDVYDAALILWELLSKKRAFRSSKRAIDTWRSMAEPRLESLDKQRPDLDERVREVTRRALTPRVEDRDITATQIALVLREIVPESEGRAHLTAMMEMVRHEPSPLPSEVPPELAGEQAPPPARVSRPMPAARSSLPTIDLSPAGNAPRVAAHVSTGATAVASAAQPTPDGSVTAVMTTMDLASKRLASGTMPSVKPGEPARTSSVKMRAAQPAETPEPKRAQSTKMAAVAPPAVEPKRTTSSAKMPAAKPPALGPKGTTSSAKMPAAKPPALEPTRTQSTKMAAVAPPPLEPKRTASAKMAAVTPPGLEPKRTTSSAKMPAAKPPPLPPRAAHSSARMSAASPAPPAAPSSSRLPAAAAPSSSRIPAAEASVEAGHTADAGAAIAPAPVIAVPTPADDEGDRPSFMSVPKVLVIDIADKPATNTGETVTAVPPPIDTTEESVVALPLVRRVEPSVAVEVDLPETTSQAQRAAPATDSSDAWFDDQPAAKAVGIPDSTEAPDDVSEPALDLSRSRPTEISIARAERRRSGRATLVMLGLLAIVGVVSADALGFVRLPVSVSARQTIMKRARAWLDVKESNQAPASPVASGVSVAPSPEPMHASASASSAPSPAPVPTTSASAAQTVPGIPTDMGILNTSGLAPNRRIFVDERTVGQTPASVMVKCGAHTLMIGSSGRRQAVEIPCGGELNAAER